jgi:hypothetical protein
MMVRKGFASAAIAALAFSSAAWASEATSSTLALAPVYADDATTAPAVAPAAAAAPATPAAAATPPKPLMALLDTTPIGTALTNAKINIFGFAEAGYYYNTSFPRQTEEPTDISFPGIFSNRVLLDQLDLQVNRTVDTTSKNIDWGFEFENMYGTDATFIHSFGWLDNRAGQKHPQNQYDITQANASIFLPVGEGLTIMAGKFATLLGYETINPTTNTLYTHSYLFTYAIPLTQTGLMGTYTWATGFNGQPVTLEAGITRGWNVSINKDVNGEPDFLGQLTFNFTPTLQAIATFSEGPEGFHDNSNYQTVGEFELKYTGITNVTLGMDSVYGDYPHAEQPKSAQWYGAAAYASYTLNSYATVNARGEWYRDNDGFTTGVRANYYEATLGVAITPFPNDATFSNLSIRPEARYDYADKAAFDLSASSGKYSEFSGAVDAIMQF